uniref:Cytochrome P450 n=1 Tax=Kalanchoe fedtschenkoi TaxID=63787 RepID=A0A7N0SZ89_KALFE
MDYTTPLILLSTLWLLLLTISTLTRSRRRLPPGPRPYPVIGNIPQLGAKPHLSLTSLAKSHGPIISLQLGRTTTVVISSPALAQKVLQKQDQAFYMRAVPDAARPLGHNRVSIVWAQSPAKFRSLRKLCNSQLFTAQRLDASQELRRLKVQQLLDYVDRSCDDRLAVEIGAAAFTTSLNLLSTTFFSTDLASYSSDESHEFKDFVWGIMEETGKPNVSDFFPALRFVDPQRVFRRARVCFEGMLRHFDRLIDQRLNNSERTEKKRESDREDVLDAMLRIVDEEGSELDRNHMIHLLLDLFIAGTDTTSSTLEWAMAELLHNPAKLEKAKGELVQVMGTNSSIEESDIASLPYIQAVVKETLRLHPPAPLLLPHKAMMDVEIDGYTIPENTRVLVNLWAIHRDEKLWPEPDSFLPERFLDDGKLSVDLIKGHGFELLPFGAGRRICPGMPLAHRMVHLMLASLLHKFDWKLENGMMAEDMDMGDKFGITLQKTVPLRAVPLRI